MIGKEIYQYKILEKIGEGGMGVVYKAEDTKLERTVALKFLGERATKNEEIKERFIREAKTAARVNHENICTVHEINEYDDKIFMVMEYIEGKPLSKILEDGPLEIKKALDLSIQIAKGLSRAHKAGITHRDIKCSNILVTNNDKAKIVDFGLALGEDFTKITTTGTSMGTIAFMSPEQVKGELVDHRTDIWSLPYNKNN